MTDEYFKVRKYERGQKDVIKKFNKVERKFVTKI